MGGIKVACGHSRIAALLLKEGPNLVEPGFEQVLPSIGAVQEFLGKVAAREPKEDVYSLPLGQDPCAVWGARGSCRSDKKSSRDE